MQFPLQQKPLQVEPQPPQFAKSSNMFTHIPLQHNVLVGHGLSQPPQFAESVCRFLHTPLQHVCPAAHIVLQLPQCVVSHTSSQQRPSQQVPSQHDCPAGQQVPSQHVSPVGHVTVSGQFEQFASLVSVQTPLQVIYPSGQQ
jgi:hypothetical protein